MTILVLIVSTGIMMQHAKAAANEPIKVFSQVRPARWNVRKKSCDDDFFIFNIFDCLLSMVKIFK